MAYGAAHEPSTKTCLFHAPVEDPVHRAQVVALGRALLPAGVKLFAVGNAAATFQEGEGVEDWGGVGLLCWEPMLHVIHDVFRRTSPSELPLYSLLKTKRMQEALRFDEATRRLEGRRGGRTDSEIFASAQLHLWNIVLHALRPNVVLAWNGWGIKDATLATAAEHYGSKVLFVERGPLQNTLQVDRDGVNGGSSFAAATLPQPSPGLSPVEQVQLQAYTSSLQRSGFSGWKQPDRESAQSLRARLGIPAEGHVLFFPGQVTTDTNVVLLSPHFSDNADVARFLAGALEGNPQWWMVVKPHPKARDGITRPRRLGPRCIICKDAHVHALIDMSDLVVTINSSVGVEAALFGKTVLQLGKGLLSNKDAVYEAFNREHAAHLLECLLKGTPPTQPRGGGRIWLYKLVFEFLYRFGEDTQTVEAGRLSSRITELAEQASFEPRSAELFESMRVVFPGRVTRRNMINVFTSRELIGTLRRRLTSLGETH